MLYGRVIPGDADKIGNHLVNDRMEYVRVIWIFAAGEKPSLHDRGLHDSMMVQRRGDFSDVCAVLGALGDWASSCWTNLMLGVGVSRFGDRVDVGIDVRLSIDGDKLGGNRRDVFSRVAFRVDLLTYSLQPLYVIRPRIFVLVFMVMVSIFLQLPI